MKPTSASLIRWTGLAAMGAGIIFAGIQPIHPLDIISSVTTTRWVVIQSFKFSMCILGLLAMVGLYTRQVKETGWLGLAGYLLFSLFYVLTSAFVFAEAFILPHLAAEAPKYVEGFLGIINGATSEVSLGVLPAIYMVGSVGYVLGGLLFGIATYRARYLATMGGRSLCRRSLDALRARHSAAPAQPDIRNSHGNRFGLAGLCTLE